jgi:hypothetical protein
MGIVARIEEESIEVSIKNSDVMDHIFSCYSIHFRALIVEIQQNTNKCTILRYKTFAIEALELAHVLALCGSSSGRIHQYLYKTWIINKWNKLKLC